MGFYIEQTDQVYIYMYTYILYLFSRHNFRSDGNLRIFRAQCQGRIGPLGYREDFRFPVVREYEGNCTYVRVFATGGQISTARVKHNTTVSTLQQHAPHPYTRSRIY